MDLFFCVSHLRFKALIRLCTGFFSTTHPKRPLALGTPIGLCADSFPTNLLQATDARLLALGALMRL